jgi:ATP-dependent Clp protease adaptor protein ClpS
MVCSQTDTDELVLTDIIEDIEPDNTGNVARLVVFNDEHNTFNWVIDCFIQVLNHSEAQAEQLALLIHLKGKATVKTASKRILKPFKDSLTEKGLSAVIEEDSGK